MHSNWLLGTRRGLPGEHQEITVDCLSSAHNLLSNGAKDMTLYAQESLRLVRSLVGEVVHRRRLQNLDPLVALMQGMVLDLREIHPVALVLVAVQSPIPIRGSPGCKRSIPRVIPGA